MERVYKEQRRLSIEALHEKRRQQRQQQGAHPTGGADGSTEGAGMGIGPGGAGGDLWPLGTFFPPSAVRHSDLSSSSGAHASIRTLPSSSPAAKGASFDVGWAKQLLLRAGDAVVVHQSCVHKVAPNLSPDIRYMVYFRVWHKDHEFYNSDSLFANWLYWRGMDESEAGGIVGTTTPVLAGAVARTAEEAMQGDDTTNNHRAASPVAQSTEGAVSESVEASQNDWDDLFEVVGEKTKPRL